MYLASWSGGKDSCFATYLAMQQGMEISHLIHFDRPFNLHGVDPALIRLQAELAGIPIAQRKVVSDDFEREFKYTVTGLRKDGARGMVFGDIYLEPHKEWIDRVCEELGIASALPLWGMSTEKIMCDFFDEGFQAVIVSGQQKFIGKEWIGRTMNRDFMEYLRARNLDVCGENGEFHTFVTGGPIFRGTIEIIASDITSRDGFWFLDIKQHEVVR
jgi:uncharacterized protein (TIGR00290 family)